MVEVNTVYIGEETDTPLGNVWLALSERGLVAVEFQTDRAAFSEHVQKLLRSAPVQISMDLARTASALQQIVEYLSGERHHFDLPIDWSVLTTFQADVLRLTYAIPRGETVTYQEIATSLGNPGAARAVGRAQATNPMPLVIPCHRVLGTDGRLHGYGAANGLESKAWLLKLESSA